MNKWVLSTIIFLIILTAIVLSIETNQDKVISITNQTLKVVNSREFLNFDIQIKNKDIEKSKSENTIKNQTIAINTKNFEPKQVKKPSNQDLVDLKFNELLNKKTKVESIWDKNQKPEIKINNTSSNQIQTKTTGKSVEFKPQKINNSNNVPKIEHTQINTTQIVQAKSPAVKTNTIQTTNSTVEKIAKLTPPVVVTPTIKKKTFNFASSDFQNELRTYLDNNVKFPQGYVVHFSFQYSNDGDLAEIHIISIPEKDYLDGDDIYISHIYGDVCKRDNLASNEMYYNSDSSISELIAIPITSTPDGPNLKQFYDTLIAISKNHKIEQVSSEEQSNYIPIGGMYYLGNLYLYTN